MSTFTDVCKTGWGLYRGEQTFDGITKDWLLGHVESFKSPVHRMPDEVRNQHLLAVGRSGCGKSSFLYGLMAKELPRALDKNLTLIYVDPVNGIDKVVNEARLFEHPNVFLVDPADPDSLPRLNLFETGVKRTGILATSHMINTFKGVCAGLIDQELTPAMMTLFGYCARVLMHVENRTLHDLMELLLAPIEYMDQLGMDPEDPAYKFFVEDVLGLGKSRGSFADTVKYVRNRVHGFLNDPIVERLFINKNPTMSISKVIEAGSVLLVATRKTDIGSDGARLIGKFFKSITNRVVQERTHAGTRRQVPIRYYEDEFQNSLSGKEDPMLCTMLDENRKFGLSINLATTRFGHVGTNTGDAVLTCTATKVCGTMVAKGVGFIAPELGRTHEEIKELPNYSLYVKCGSDMKQAIIVKSPKDPFKSFGKTDSKGMMKLRKSMNVRFGTSYVKRKPASEAQGSAIEDVDM